MIGDRVGMTVAADLSANVFAAFLLILIVLLARSGTPEPATRPAPIEASRDLDTRTHRPEAPAGLVELLRLRGPAAPGLTVDLHAERIEIGLPGRRTRTVLALAGIDRASAAARIAAATLLAEPGAVRLYVFDAAWYGAVTARLVRDGRSWRELSVPAALRVGGQANGAAWAPAFEALVARSADPGRFRAGLAEIIAGSGGERVDRPVPGGRNGGGLDGSPVQGETLSERLGRYGRMILALLAVTASLALVIYAETRRPSRRRT